MSNKKLKFILAFTLIVIVVGLIVMKTMPTGNNVAPLSNPPTSNQ
jgi:uncharacterized membrane-anchored protein